MVHQNQGTKQRSWREEWGVKKKKKKEEERKEKEEEMKETKGRENGLDFSVFRNERESFVPKIELLFLLSLFSFICCNPIPPV